MEFVNNTFIYFFAFIIVLTIIVFVHEFGHYFAAIINKVKVETFSIGFGKEIFGWTDKRGTRWKIGYLPLGGYVKMFGEDVLNKKKIPKNQAKYAFSEKKLHQRFIIVLAGPLANFILGIIGYAFIYTFIGISHISPVINEVLKDTPAYSAGLKNGDKILQIDNRKIKSFFDIGQIINVYKKPDFNFTILRENTEIIKKITPVIVVQEIYGQERDIRKIGITSFESEKRKYNFFYSLYLGSKSTYNICHLTIEALSQLITGKGSVDDLGGPVKIAHFSGKMFQEGFLSFLNLIILLSISIGLINLFPLPVLDGGHLVMYLVEGIIGKPINADIQKLAFKIGFIIIITLAVLLTYNDILSLFKL